MTIEFTRNAPNYRQYVIDKLAELERKVDALLDARTNLKLADVEEKLDNNKKQYCELWENHDRRLDKVEGWTKIKRIQIDKAKELFEQHQQIHALEERLDKLEDMFETLTHTFDLSKDLNICT